jgi:hypothetical protein
MNYANKIFQLNWHMARVDCKSKGMELATLETKEKNDLVFSSIGRSIFLLNLQMDKYKKTSNHAIKSVTGLDMTLQLGI